MVVGSWRKSSYSGNNGGDCVEVGHQDTDVAVRDTKNREGAGSGSLPMRGEGSLPG